MTHPLDEDAQFCRAISQKWESVPASAKQQYPRCRLGARFTREDNPAEFHPALLEIWNVVRYIAKPRRALEIGVAAGTSSAVLLHELATRPPGGTLVSLDKPSTHPRGYTNSDGKNDGVFTPANYGSGWIVPDYLRSRWTLVLGESPRDLPSIWEKYGPFDFVFQDGDHGRSAVRTELQFFWDHLERPWTILADDVSWSSAFDEFIAEHQRVEGLSMLKTEHDRGIVHLA